jgi:hypothetical protein
MNGTCVGGVNADGTFWCGGQAVVLDGVALTVSSGVFGTSGGAPTGFDTTSELTIVATIDGVASDCDVRGHGTGRFAAR